MPRMERGRHSEKSGVFLNRRESPIHFSSTVFKNKILTRENAFQDEGKVNTFLFLGEIRNKKLME